MFIHHLFKTPQKKKHNQTITYSPSDDLPQSNLHQRSKFRQHLHQLYDNFHSLSSTVDVDLTRNHFNLIQYEKEDEKIRYDPQMMVAKLRRLENQAQINRIQMQLDQRKKKKRKSRHYEFTNNEYETTPYQKTYAEFLKNSKLMDMPQNDSQSQEDQTQPKPKGISRFHQLKKHQKILDFTLKKMQQRQEQSILQQKQSQQRKQAVKLITNQLKDFGQYADLTKKKSSSMSLKESRVNPEIIVQDKFKRIMTMKAKDKVTDQVKLNPRCNKMIGVQNEILLGLEEQKKSLSKDNMKKLKSRFIQIVNELHKGDKKRKEIRFLPSIETTAFTARKTGRTKDQQKQVLHYVSNTFDIKKAPEIDTIDTDHLHLESKAQHFE